MLPDEFQYALMDAYLQAPCQVLAAPLWQTLPGLEGIETSVARDTQGVNRLEAYTDDSLLVYWRRSGRQPSLLVNRRLEYQRFALIHQDFLDAPTVAGFISWEFALPPDLSSRDVLRGQAAAGLCLSDSGQNAR